MSHHHVREVCMKCGTVLVQCRCIESKVDTPKGLCKKCSSVVSQPVEGEKMQLIHGDCLEKMRDIPDGSIDLVLTDPPYGTTACKWDTIIPFGPMWEQLRRITKKNGAIVLFGSQPFTSALVMSNPKMFKYEWVWEKSKPTGFINAKNAPLKKHENICVFSSGATANNNNNRMCYMPQGITKSGAKKKSKYSENDILGVRPCRNNGGYIQEYTGFPNSLIKYNSEINTQHPTQKPVALMEYLIKTYTNEGETVLDFTMGSGTTGVACKKLGRKFIGIEIDQTYFNIAKERIEKA